MNNKSDKMKKKALLVKMDSETHKMLKIKTTEQGENMTAVVLRLIQGYLSEVAIETTTEKK